MHFAVLVMRALAPYLRCLDTRRSLAAAIGWLAFALSIGIALVASVWVGDIVGRDLLDLRGRQLAARRASISLRAPPGHGLALTGIDDGAGFDTGAAHPGHCGLAGICERAQPIVAEVTIRSALQQATGIVLEDRHPAKHDDRLEAIGDRPLGEDLDDRFQAGRRANGPAATRIPAPRPRQGQIPPAGL